MGLTKHQKFHLIRDTGFSKDLVDQKMEYLRNLPQKAIMVGMRDT